MEVTLFAEKIFHIGSFPITNTLLTTLLTTLLLTVFAIVVSKKVSLTPTSKLQLVSEIVIESIFSTIEDLSDTKRAKRFFPIIATFFHLYLGRKLPWPYAWIQHNWYPRNSSRRKGISTYIS